MVNKKLLYEQIMSCVAEEVKKYLNESNINLLTDLDDSDLDLLDSILTKSVNSKINVYLKYIDEFKNAIEDIIVLSNTTRDIINDPKHFKIFNGIIKAENKTHLKRLIEKGKKLLGYFGNFNWIDTSNITDMSYLFFEEWSISKAERFNGDISLWDVSNVEDMESMFDYCSLFNCDLSNWNVSNVKNMRAMFRSTKFNSNIGDWDVSNVTNMNCMFIETPFNLDISNWDVSNVTEMGCMFYNAHLFNQPIGNWDVSNVTAMNGMFAGCGFNLDISNWDVSNVIWMEEMFRCSAFNNYIGDWDVSNVKTMREMFAFDEEFNQDLSKWKLNKNCCTIDMFIGCPIKDEYKPTIQ